MAEFILKLITLIGGDPVTSRRRARFLVLALVLVIGFVFAAAAREVIHLADDTKAHLQEYPVILQEFRTFQILALRASDEARADRITIARQNLEIIERLSRLEGEVKILRRRGQD
jgi:hypothetical protein